MFLRRFPLNIRAIKAKLKLPKNKKKTHGTVIFLLQLRRTHQDFSSQADPAKENLI